MIGAALLIKKNQHSPTDTLRLGYSFFGSITEIDPKDIQSIYQANIIENIFSRLIEYDLNGQIICSLCSSFKIDGRQIFFSFDSSNLTADGLPINAEDALVSLNRIMKSQTNTHGSLSYFLDPKDGMRIQSSQLVITVAKANWAPFVLTLLTSMDFSIIPRSSLSDDGEQIINYQRTSGPYFVSTSAPNGSFKLGANTHHSLYKKSMPQSIEFVPLKSGEAAAAFSAKKIDMIDTTYFAYADDISEILRATPNAQLHETLHIGLTTLVFSNRSMASSSETDRLTAGAEVKDILFQKARKIYGAADTNQFFQSFGQGFIKKEQQDFLKNRKLNSAHPNSARFTFGVTERYRNWLKQEDFPSYITLKFYDSYPGFLPEQDRPDIYILNTDSSFDEDISALSYQFSQGTFSLSKGEGALWIQEYMNLETRESRIQRLQDFHFKMLKEVKVYPISSKPYVTICTDEWSFEFPKLYAGTPLWKIWKK
jgi:hypothetical protein